MPPASFPSKWHEVVRGHHADTEGFVVAQRGECLSIRDDERDLVRGRRFKPLPPDRLPPSIRGSWFMGVLLCPGDETAAIAAWAARLPAVDLDRIHFYFIAAVDLPETLAAWRGRGLREPRTFEVRDFQTFHKLYGRHHGDRVYLDFS